MKTYKDIIGWMNYEDLYDQVVKEFKGGTLVEVGVFLGKSLIYLTYEAMKSGHKFRICGVDTFRGSGDEKGVGNLHHEHLVNGSLAGKCHSNLIDCLCFHVVDLLVCTSVRAATYFPDNSVEFVFIDAAHDYESVKTDILTWLTKVKPGGWLCGHDYEKSWEDVVKAVDELLPNHDTVSHTCWRYIKPCIQ